MPLDAVIFDVDGTLIDSNELHALTWQQVLRDAGFEVPLERIRPEIGKGGDQLLPTILGAETAEAHPELEENYTPVFLRLIKERGAPAFPGARELLQAIRGRGLRISVATSGKKEFLEALEAASGLEISEMCDVLVTTDDAENSKPKPDIVEAAVRKLGLSPAQCAMIGDTPHDAIACRAAGVVCLALECGGNAEDVLRSQGARGVWRDAAALLEDLDAALQLAAPARCRWTAQKLEELMEAALDAARDGMEAGEVPIGCVLANGKGEIVARGWNEMNATQGKIAHAEIQTFIKATGQLDPEAKDTMLVSTLEPCVMCTGAAMEAAVDTIVYALRAPADSGTHRVAAPQSPESQMPRIVGDVLADESRALFEQWLAANKGTKQAEFVEQLLALTESSSENEDRESR